MKNQETIELHQDDVNKLHIESNSGRVANVHTSKEDAERLVKAWNNHDSLLEALIMARDTIKDRMGYTDKSVGLKPIIDAINKATK